MSSSTEIVELLRRYFTVVRRPESPPFHTFGDLSRNPADLDTVWRALSLKRDAYFPPATHYACHGPVCQRLASQFELPSPAPGETFLLLSDFMLRRWVMNERMAQHQEKGARCVGALVVCDLQLDRYDLSFVKQLRDEGIAYGSLSRQSYLDWKRP